MTLNTPRLPGCTDDEHGMAIAVAPFAGDEEHGFQIHVEYCACLIANNHRGAIEAAEALKETLQRAIDEAMLAQETG